MVRSAHLDDVTAGVFGVGADEHGEERRGAIVGRHHAQHGLEVVLVPGSRQGPSSDLKRGGG